MACIESGKKVKCFSYLYTCFYWFPDICGTFVKYWAFYGLFVCADRWACHFFAMWRVYIGEVSEWPGWGEEGSGCWL